MLTQGEELILLDIREPDKLPLARIGGPIHIPMREVPARQMDLDDEKRIVVNCHLDPPSATVTQYMRNEGFILVQYLRGGINSCVRKVNREKVST